MFSQSLLCRVASNEDVNRMTASALAIVFAPCILRTNKVVPAQDSLSDIARQTQVVETIISEQLRKLRVTLADIDTLDTAAHTATDRLSSIRSSKVCWSSNNPERISFDNKSWMWFKFGLLPLFIPLFKVICSTSFTSAYQWGCKRFAFFRVLLKVLFL